MSVRPPRTRQRTGPIRRQRVLRVLLTVFLVAAGVMHFALPGFYLPMMPPSLPWREELLLVTGAFEILFGLALLSPRTARRAAWGIVALFILMFPANLAMAVNGGAVDGILVPPLLLWGRLPIQGLLIAWALLFTRRPAIVRQPRQYTRRTRGM
jgi:uncharacterized membrane protein